jgi:hypothetical protein
VNVDAAGRSVRYLETCSPAGPFRHPIAAPLLPRTLHDVQAHFERHPHAALRVAPEQRCSGQTTVSTFSERCLRVAASGVSRNTILAAGVAALGTGVMAMAIGEYVSRTMTVVQGDPSWPGSSPV